MARVVYQKVLPVAGSGRVFGLMQRRPKKMPKSHRQIMAELNQRKLDAIARKKKREAITAKTGLKAVRQAVVNTLATMVSRAQANAPQVPTEPAGQVQQPLLPPAPEIPQIEKPRRARQNRPKAQAA